MEHEKRKFDQIESVDNAGEDINQKRQLASEIEDPHKVFMEEMIVPRERVAVVIGNKGVVIQEIMRRTGTKVTINQKVEPNVAQISGKAEQNKSAKDLILRVIESGPGGLEDNSLGEIVSSTMECPQERVGGVIGAKGHVLQEIMKRTSTQVSIDQNTPEGHPAIVHINGRSEKIEEVKILIALVIKDGPSAILTTSSGSGEGGEVLAESMDIAKEKVGPTIGAKGVVIQDIMRRSGCKIIIEQETTPCKVVFTGTRAQIDAAVNLVQLVVANGASALQMVPKNAGMITGSFGNLASIGLGVPIGSTITHEIPIVQSQVGKLLGPQGTIIKEFQSKTGVKAKVDVVNSGTDERVIRLVGEVGKVRTAAHLAIDLIENGPQVAFQRFDVAMRQQMPQPHYLPSYDPYSSYGQPLAHQAYNPYDQQQTRQQNAYAYQPQAQYAPSYGQQSQYAPSQVSGVMPAAIAGTLGLGHDGSSGQLLPATVSGNGLHCQIAHIRSTEVGKVIGKGFVTLSLIKQKSGANLHLSKEPPKGAPDFNEISITGSQQSTLLAGQMVQEALTAGLAKIQAMQDVPPTYHSGAAPAYAQATLSTAGGLGGYYSNPHGSVASQHQAAYSRYGVSPSPAQSSYQPQGYGAPLTSYGYGAASVSAYEPASNVYGNSTAQSYSFSNVGNPSDAYGRK